MCVCEQVHRWVNYESMLKECLVGRMSTKAATAVRGTQRFTSIYTLCRKTQPLTKSMKLGVGGLLTSIHVKTAVTLHPGAAIVVFKK